MQRRLTVSLVALQMVACGYAVEAQDVAKRPAYAASAAARVESPARTAATTTAAVKPEKRDEVTMRLTPRFVSAPGYLRSLVRVVPNADNRVLRVAIDSDRYYRSSDIELEGDTAAESHFVDFKGVPAGRYELVVTVLGPGGDARVQRQLTFQVLGITDEN